MRNIEYVHATIMNFKKKYMFELFLLNTDE